MNEPVAYGKYIENAKMWLVVELNEDMPESYIPLYTHPAELTDEEIIEVATINLGHSMGLLNWMGFARAILRKAQEK
jgi:hypothetical protein